MAAAKEIPLRERLALTGMRDWEVKFKGMTSGTSGTIFVRATNITDALERFYETLNKVAVVITTITDGSDD
jgi:hypothetical protein